MLASRAIRRGRPGQRGGWQVALLDVGLAGEARGGHRAAVCRGFLPQHCLPPEQERDPQRESRQLFPGRGAAEFGIATGDWRVDDDRRPRPQAEDGGRACRAPLQRESTGAERAAEPAHGPRGSSSRPRTVEVGRFNAGGIRTIRGENVVIDTGSRARIDDTPGLAESRPLTHVEALDLDQLPEHP